MTSSRINIALKELEQTLGNLESARNQVNGVAATGEKVIEAFTKASKTLKKVESSFGANGDAFVQEMSELRGNIELRVTDQLSDLGKTIQQGEDSIVEGIELFNKQLKRSDDQLSKFKKAIIDAETKVRSTDFERQFKDLENSMNGQVKAIEGSVANQINKFDRTLASHLDDISRTLGNFNVLLEDKLDEHRALLKARMDEQHQTIQQVLKDHSSRNQMVLAIGFSVVILLVILFGSGVLSK